MFLNHPKNEELNWLDRTSFISTKGDTMTTESKTRTEEFQVSGDKLVAKIKEIVHEGNIRRIAIKNEAGRVLIDIPLTLGVVGALLAPQLAAIGAIAALVAQCTIVVEKEAQETGEEET
jgi:hypothetical protein